VRPYNLTSTCPQNTEVKAKGFSTDVSSSNVLDINALENFVVFPNPIQSDGILKIKINAKHAGKITLSLNDITGRQIMSQRQLLNDGENEIDFPIGTLSTGLYLLRLDAPVGSVQRKVSVF
jgi:hypothetical protein